MRRGPTVVVIAAGAMLAGCSGVQSTLSPQGPGAERIAILTWVLIALCGSIFTGVLAAIWIAIRGPEGLRHRIAGTGIVVGGGIVFPAVTLTLLLGYGVWQTQAGIATPDSRALRIEVVGEQWWWRLVYVMPGGQQVAGANEIRIPTGRAVDLSLRSADVIHSFWVPNLGGKVDMIPGRTTYLRVAADRPGVFRGQCAEYCGGPHALMALDVVAMPEDEYRAWLDQQAAPAGEPGTEAARRGQELFLAAGCGACHAVRGTPAAGTVGPDLTHVGSRRSIAASTLPLTREGLTRFIAEGQHVKPGNRMPPYRIFSPAELDAVAAYLEGLR